MPPATPVGDQEFAAAMAAFGPFGAGRRVAVAVSGGADSLCLAWLARRWGAPHAVVVDHGLRPASAAEAELTLLRLQRIHVPATSIRLALPCGPALGERARAARYDALLSWCRAAGLPDLLLGHHAQDQAETVALRIGAGSGPAGQAGMAAMAWRHDARLLRPLLGIDRARLRTTLRAAGVDWVEDPTNADVSTPRGAMRQKGTVLPAAPDGAGLRRHTLDRTVAAELAANVCVYPGGYAEVRGPLGAAAWCRLVWLVSGRAYPPGAACGHRFAAGQDGTAHGVLVRAGWVMREPAACGPPVPAAAGTVWDGRFTVARDLPGAEVGALGPADAARLRRRPGLPAAVLAGLPTVRADGNLLAVPHNAYPDAATCLSVIARFRPVCPLAGAPFGLARPG